MTLQQTPDGASSLSSPSSTRAVLLAAAVALIVALVGAYALGQRNPTTHSTEVRCAAAERSISCQPVDDDGKPDHDGWTYSVPLDVDWTGGGAEHPSGRPDCLPAAGGFSDVVRLSWLDVSVDGKGWRAVISVAC